jgi:hypothetical protein
MSILTFIVKQALGDGVTQRWFRRREPGIITYYRQQLACLRHAERVDLRAIAAELDATVEQVQRWLEPDDSDEESLASESGLCGFSAQNGEIARACGLICVMRGTEENHFPPVAAPDAAKVSVGK